MGHQQKIRVLVVDEQPLLRSGCESLIDAQADMEVVGLGGTPAQALELTRDTSPDVALMELRYQGTMTAGLTLVRELKVVAPRSSLLVYTSQISDAVVHIALRSGVAGFLPKTVEPDALIHAIRAAACGEYVFSREIAGRLTVTTVSGSESSSESENHLLTAREAEAIQLIAEGLDNEQVALRLSLSPSSVRLCLTSAYLKLGARNRTDAVVKAHRMGAISLD